MNHTDIIDQHLIIRETVGYEVLNEVPIQDMPKIMEFLKIVYNYNRMKRIEAEKTEYLEHLEEVEEQNQKSDRTLIKEILSDRSNAYGKDEIGNPRYIYEGYMYVLNEELTKILSVSFERVDGQEPRWSSKWNDFGKTK